MSLALAESFRRCRPESFAEVSPPVAPAPEASPYKLPERAGWHAFQHVGGWCTWEGEAVSVWG